MEEGERWPGEYPADQLRKDLKQAVELKEQAAALQAEWLRRVLAAAVAVLAVLAGLGPEAAGPTQRYLLAACWVLLGTGVLSGSGATYLHAAAARARAASFQASLSQAVRAGKPLDTSQLIVGTPWRWLSWCRHLMVGSLLGAVVCLVIYMVLRTLNG